MSNNIKPSLKSFLLAGVLLAGTAAAVSLYPQAGVKHPAQQVAPIQPQVQPHIKPNAQLPQPKVEVVFVLDTTSSMSGLIDAAKNNIWSIATSMASAKPAPQMHMGLVAFRDRGDDYVTRVLDLSQDLDSMYASLLDFKAQGGGDGPESVNAALFAAVNNVSWSQDKNSYKVIFLVGDAPPHMDYQDDVQYPEILQQAKAKGIVVNCIQAGNNNSTKQIWQQIAQLNQGAFFQVEQSGSAVAMTTPFDEKLATLSKQLDDSRLFYGSKEQRSTLDKKAQAADKLHASAPASVRAKRAEFNSSKAGADNLYASSELVDGVASGAVDLDALAESELPEPIAKLTKKEQHDYIAKVALKRKQIQLEMERLGQQRQQYIVENLDEAKADDSLDGKIYGAVKEQAKSKGLSYQSRPVF